jgi:hypothetical protein
VLVLTAALAGGLGASAACGMPREELRRPDGSAAPAARERRGQIRKAPQADRDTPAEAPSRRRTRSAPAGKPGTPPGPARRSAASRADPAAGSPRAGSAKPSSPQPRAAVAPPRPKPGSAPASEPAARAAPARPEAEPRRTPSAAEEADEEICRARLAAQGIRFEPLPPLPASADCDAVKPLQVLSLASDLALAAPATLTCRMTEALAKWAAEAVIPAAEEQFKAKPSAMFIGTSYACRPRNNRSGAKLSEHAAANALDVAGFKFDHEADVRVADSHAPDSPEARFLADIRAKACAYFRTVLGPGTDPEHSSHYHLDLRQRQGDRRLCQ